MTSEPRRGRRARPPDAGTPPGTPGSPDAPVPGPPYQPPGPAPQPDVQPSQPHAQPESGDPGQQPYAPPPQQPPQPYAAEQPHAQQPYAPQQQPQQQPYAPVPPPGQQPGPYDYQPPPQPDYLQSAQPSPYPPLPSPHPSSPPRPQPGAGPGAPSPAPSPYDLPLPPPPTPADPPRPGPGPSFDGPLPDAPSDVPPLQWGTPLSGAAPAPKAHGPKPLSTLAVASLVLAVISGLPALVAVLLERDFGRWLLVGSLGGGCGLALVLGLVALVRCRGGRRRGAGLAVAGLVVTALWGGVSAFAYVQGTRPEARDATGKVVRKGQVEVTSLRVGDCVETWAVANTVGDVTVLPCTSDHDAEVFHTFTAAGGDAYPGDKPLSDEATTQCVAKAKTAVTPDDVAKAKIAYLKPVESSWKKKQKQITCIVVMPAKLARSVRV